MANLDSLLGDIEQQVKVLNHLSNTLNVSPERLAKLLDFIDMSPQDFNALTIDQQRDLFNQFRRLERQGKI